ncbi:hypothetical protein SAMN05421833_13080 [Microbispora rosea]|uniref:Uncharacterized protein n=1 Tax=Microbispora rosea TaxID=58117 RepID=A0A1N7GMR8_9ACTN|nr:hypothetical protein SAMN05421833_13080 [Microbispora rosea]
MSVSQSSRALALPRKASGVSNEHPPTVAEHTRAAFNEDWAATIVGLVLLVLVITGVIPTGLVP